jgi:MarR family 2-MHQ and catechol resistance regulon transcriptional repressor
LGGSQEQNTVALRPKTKNREKDRSAAPSLAQPKLRALLDDPQIESWRSLMAAFQAIYTRLESALRAEESCSIPRFQILFYLYFEGPLPASEIAKRLLVTRGNISTFLKRLESDGVIRPAHADAGQKRHRLELTPLGVKQFEQLFPRHIRRVKNLMPAFPQGCLSLLNQIAKPPALPKADSDR